MEQQIATDDHVNKPDHMGPQTGPFHSTVVKDVSPAHGVGRWHMPARPAKTLDNSLANAEPGNVGIGGQKKKQANSTPQAADGNGSLRFFTVNDPKKLKDKEEMRAKRQHVMQDFLRKERQRSSNTGIGTSLKARKRRRDDVSIFTDSGIHLSTAGGIDAPERLVREVKQQKIETPISSWTWSDVAQDRPGHLSRATNNQRLVNWLKLPPSHEPYWQLTVEVKRDVKYHTTDSDEAKHEASHNDNIVGQDTDHCHENLTQHTSEHGKNCIKIEDNDNCISMQLLHKLQRNNAGIPTTSDDICKSARPWVMKTVSSPEVAQPPGSRQADPSSPPHQGSTPLQHPPTTEDIALLIADIRARVDSLLRSSGSDSLRLLGNTFGPFNGLAPVGCQRSESARACTLRHGAANCLRPQSEPPTTVTDELPGATAHWRCTAGSSSSGTAGGGKRQSSSCNNLPTRTLKRTLNATGSEDDTANDGGPEPKQQRTEYDRRTIQERRKFACIYHVGEPALFARDVTRYEYISELDRHLRNRHQYFACSKCFTQFADKQEWLEHERAPCVKVCADRGCRRKQLISNEANGHCRCIRTAEQQWRELFSLKYPVVEMPANPFGAIADTVVVVDQEQPFFDVGSSMPFDFETPIIETLDAKSFQWPFDVPTDPAITGSLGVLPTSEIVGQEALLQGHISGLVDADVRQELQSLRQQVSLLEQRLFQPSKREREIETVLGMVWKELATADSSQTQPNTHLWNLVSVLTPNVISSSTTTKPAHVATRSSMEQQIPDCVAQFDSRPDRVATCMPSTNGKAPVRREQQTDSAYSSGSGRVQ